MMEEREFIDNRKQINLEQLEQSLLHLKVQNSVTTVQSVVQDEQPQLVEFLEKQIKERE